MKNKGLTFALMAMVISGVSVFANGQLIKGMDPIVQTVIKNGIVGIMITAWLLASKKLSGLTKLTGGEWAKLGLVALIGGSLSFGLFFTGLKMTGTIDGSLIQKSMVVWVLLLAIPLLREKVSLWLAIAAGGLYAVNFLGGTRFGSFGMGHAMVLAATILWSFESIMIKKFMQSMNTDLLLFGRMVLGSVLLFGYMVMTGRQGLIPAITATQWQGLLLVSVLLFGYVMMWYRALRYAPAVHVSSILVGATVITTALSSTANGQLSTTQLISSLIISGLVSAIIMMIQKTNRYQLPTVRSEI